MPATTVVIKDDTTIILEAYTFQGDSQANVRWRPTEVTAPIKDSTTTGRGKAPKAMALLNNPTEKIAGQYNDPNVRDNSLLRPLNTDNSHLVGLSIGGPDVSGNVVPVYSHLNQGACKGWETQIKQLKANDRGNKGNNQIAYVNATVEYKGSEPHIPSQIRLAIFNTAFKPTSHTWFLENKPTGPQRVSPDDLATKDIQKAFDLWDKQVQSEGWKLEQREKVPNLPNNGIPRPYAFLDAMYFAGALHAYLKLVGVTDYQASTYKEFAEWQKALIILVNRLRNKGWLKSDQSGNKDEPFKELLDVPGDQGAHIDHIVSKNGGGGANVFSNAQVVSRAYNDHKSSKAEGTSVLSASASGGSPPVFVGRTRADEANLKAKKEQSGEERKEEMQVG